MMQTLMQLLFSFLQIGLFSIGGGYATIPLIAEQVIDLHHWLTLQEFTDIITISQMTPGPLAVNTSTFVGLRIAGPLGAVTATFGCVISGFLLSLLLYRFFARHSNSQYVSAALDGLKAGSTGLIASAAGTMIVLALCGSSVFVLSAVDPAALILMLASLAALRLFKLHPILLMALTGAVGFLLYTPGLLPFSFG